MVDVVAKDDGLLVRIGGLEELGDLLCDQLGTRLDHQVAVHVLEVVDAVLDQLAVLVEHALGRPPALQIFVEVDAHYLVGGEEAILDALLEGVAVNRLAEIGDAGNVFGFLGRGGKADMGGAGEVLEDLAPGRVLGGAATVAFVDYHQVEEVRRELLVDVLLFFGASDGLVQRQVDLVGGVDLALGDLGHRLAERLEVVVLGLVDQDVAVGQEEDALLLPRFPKPPDDLEGGVGLAGAGGHHQQDAILATRHRLDGAVDGIHLVVAWHAPGAVVVIRRLDPLFGFALQALPPAVALPEFIRTGKLVEAQLGFHLLASAAAVVEQEAIAIAGKHEGHVQRLGITESLLHAGADGVLVVLGFDNCDGQVGLVIKNEVSAAGLATAMQLAAHDDAALGKADFLAHLFLDVPTGLLNGRGDELGADIPLGKRFLVHGWLCPYGVPWTLPDYVEASRHHRYAARYARFETE
ncbi:hypothetical protein FQZ97_718060 [compost metagenome]